MGALSTSSIAMVIKSNNASLLAPWLAKLSSADVRNSGHLGGVVNVSLSATLVIYDRKIFKYLV